MNILLSNVHIILLAAGLCLAILNLILTLGISITGINVPDKTIRMISIGAILGAICTCIGIVWYLSF